MASATQPSVSKLKLIRDPLLGFQYIQELIRRNLSTKGTKPIFIGRLSGNETRLAGLIKSNKPIDNALLYRLQTGAGLKLTSLQDAIDYVRVYTEAVQNTTALGIWDGGMFKQAEDFYGFLNTHYNRQAFMAHSLEPFYYMKDSSYKFDEILKGKKIAIISSHSASIEKQIREGNVEKVFDKVIIPLTAESEAGKDYVIIRPPVQLGEASDGRSWKSHFEEFKIAVRTELVEELEETTEMGEAVWKQHKKFDIVFASCGGFGMPICNFIYNELGISVVYVGGPLQLFFGVKGKRWETNEQIKKHFRDGWTSVLSEDIPVGIHHTEDGCYW